MSMTALLVAAIVVAPAFGLAAWVWLAMSCANDDLGSFEDFDAMRLYD